MSNKVLAYYYIAGPRRNTLVDDEVRNREKQGEGHQSGGHVLQASSPSPPSRETR